MGFQADCPTCGAPIEFSIATSVVTVCKNCSTVAGRGGDALENFGKVADLVDTDSPLQVGITGESRGVPFEITGRTQLKHAAGGVWDEWYVAFRDGKTWGWLAEARGRYYLTFHKKLPRQHNIPPIDQLSIEDEVMIPKYGLMKVVEIGGAEVVSGEGEIPYQLHPGERYLYADLEGAGDKFATLDGGGESLQVFVGGEFPLQRLGIGEEVADREKQERSAAAKQVSCPNCGGSLELNAPDETERVGCPFCGGLLDVNQGNLKFLKVLGNQVKPTIPLGTEGTFEGDKFKVIGFMQRSVHAEGREYIWSEYLLYAPRKPFHWLIENERHWTFAKPVSAGKVRCSYRTADCDGMRFRLFDRGVPQVRYVVGEFYWKVEIGERVGAADYVRPPYLLSREESVVEADPNAPPVRMQGKAKTPAVAKEVNYTLGRYMPVEEIQQAFGLKQLSLPSSVAPNQPYPYKYIYGAWLILLAAVLCAGLFVFVTAPRKQVFSQQFDLKQTTATDQVEFVDEPIELRGWRNLEITASNDQSGRWSYAAIDFIDANDKTRTITAALPLNRSGPKRSAKKFASPLPRGKYHLRFSFQWQDMKLTSQKLNVRIRQGAPRLYYFLLLLLMVSIVPIGVAIHQGIFEASRWSQSGV